MDKVDQPKARIQLGPVTLTQQKDGRLIAEHAALTAPLEIDQAQLQRWLLRQLREQVTV